MTAAVPPHAKAPNLRQGFGTQAADRELDMTNATLEFSPSIAHTYGAEANAALFYDREGFFVR